MNKQVSTTTQDILDENQIFDEEITKLLGEHIP